jgi:small-conductance mechanosensitive channel
MENKIPNYLLNTIKNISRNKKVRIKFNEDLSELISINEGVRLGC